MRRGHGRARVRVGLSAAGGTILNHGARAALRIALAWASLALASASLAEVAADADGDGIPDALDKCSIDPRNTGPAGCDTDCDGYGNVCDADFDQSGTVSTVDFRTYFVPAFASGVPTPRGTDLNCSGAVNSVDFSQHFVPEFKRGKPGPSGLACAGTPRCGC